MATVAITSFPRGTSGKEPVCQYRRQPVQSLGQEDPLEEKMATHFSTLAWRIPLTEGPGELQSLGLQRAGLDWSDLEHVHLITKYHWLDDLNNRHSFLMVPAEESELSMPACLGSSDNLLLGLQWLLSCCISSHEDQERAFSSSYKCTDPSPTWLHLTAFPPKGSTYKYHMVGYKVKISTYEFQGYTNTQSITLF